MRRILALLILLAACLGPATSALARPSTRSVPSAMAEGVGEPIVSARPGVIPPGFTSTAAQAIIAAKAAPAMQALHRREHPLFVQAFVWDQAHWWINFYRGDHTAAVVDVSPAGRVTGVWIGPYAFAVYTHGNYNPLFDRWYVVVPFALLFLVPFVDWRRWRRMLHLDALVLLSFLGSYALFEHIELRAAVWCIYPPLVYLLGRMIAVGFGRARLVRPPRLDPRLLLAGLVVLTIARIVLSFIYTPVSDVGYASVLGAHRITHGQPLYFADPSHGDTYGPINYLAYVPFEMLFPWTGRWDYLLSAHLASAVFDLVTIGALVLLGRRMAPGRAGSSLGLTLGWVWAACPFTLLVLIGHTNDGLVAMLSVLSLLAFASPVRRGVLLGLAAAAKFSPGALLPLFAGPRRTGRSDARNCIAACGAVLILSVVLFLPSGGVAEFWQQTLGFQLTRTDVFSAWALHPSLDFLKVAIEAAAVLFSLALYFLPRRRTLAQVSALAAAVTIALQIPAVHWFYYYIAWFVPFVAVALLAGQDAPPTDSPRPERGRPFVLPAALEPVADLVEV